MKLRRAAALLMGCVFGALAFAAQAEDAAEVSSVSGTVVVQRADGSVRSLAPHSTVQTGDVITSQPNSSARLTFTDKGELTVAGNSQVRIDAYSFINIAPERDSMVMSLLKGGLRSVTGFVARRGNPDAYRLRTATATIGIRGTDYFARLCADDCTKDVGQAPPPVPGVDIAARVALISGEIVVTDKLGRARALRRGGPVYEGDVVESRAQGVVVLVFRDDGVVTLHSGARLNIERYHFKATQPEQGVSSMRLLQGGMRVMTGVLAKRRPRSYKLITATATIGIRGTGFDVWCSGLCESGASGTSEAGPAADPVTGGLYVSTWEGEVEVTNTAGALPVRVGQIVFVAAPDRAPVYLPALPPNLRDAPAPRPDGVKIDRQALFGADATAQTDQGLYVLVNEGKVALRQGDRILELERGESGYASFDQTRLYLLQETPIFLGRDRALSATSEGGLMCTF